MAPPRPELEKQYMSTKPVQKVAEPRPSASILLISPTNEILLLHRVRTSSSFPSAHVFPGGNLSASQDGDIPGADDAERHVDGRAYRVGAIRECFEESGILLARKKDGEGLLEVEEESRENGRKDVHANKVGFEDWVKEQGGVLDIDSLQPFTRWVTPTNLPKRFTTQMYIYFLPLPLTSSLSSTSSLPTQSRNAVLEFLKGDGGDGKGIKWADKAICPIGLMMRKSDGRSVLSLDQPGPELKNSGRRGDEKRVVLVKFGKEGPRDVDVWERKEVLEEQKREGAKL
ncbi:related to NUDIX family hydrolase [Rhynchosporium secalis]|uniref:Related to NUDIX family hydrolase n=1 Tax=Rhynchosporium secalis TaxID=38038 RepID=A0A1E1MSD6_RHYSE|nr:related to NUDIX family hydrolase [Rhynchosporium secalis]